MILNMTVRARCDQDLPDHVQDSSGKINAAIQVNLFNVRSRQLEIARRVKRMWHNDRDE